MGDISLNCAIIAVRWLGMNRMCSLFGHSRLWKSEEVAERLYAELELLVSEGILVFQVGTHGEFDKVALSQLRRLRRSHPDIKISVVFTTLTILTPDKDGNSRVMGYEDVEVTTYPIEEVHFKNQIVVNNQMMVDQSDVILCCVDFAEYRSGAKRAVKYAQKQGKRIINVFKESDRPFYGMTQEEKDEYWKKVRESLK